MNNTELSLENKRYLADYTAKMRKLIPREHGEYAIRVLADDRYSYPMDSIVSMVIVTAQRNDQVFSITLFLMDTAEPSAMQDIVRDKNLRYLLVHRALQRVVTPPNQVITFGNMRVDPRADTTIEGVERVVRTLLGDLFGEDVKLNPI